MHRFMLLGVAAIALALAGCGGDDGDDNGSGGTGGDGACTDLQNTAPQITEVDLPQDPPTPMGLVGITALQDGVYFFAADTVFTGVGGGSGPTEVTHKSTWRITGNNIEIANKDATRGDETGKGTFTISGDELSFTFDCPAGRPGGTVKFTASAGTIQIFDDDGNNVDTYALQP